jgi:dTDP-4-amino-4,6-dideoxygalactose transaminase
LRLPAPRYRLTKSPATSKRALCEYTGSKYAVTTTSCTMAIQMACAYHLIHGDSSKFSIGIHGEYGRFAGRARWLMPNRSYVGVPAAIINAGAGIEFIDLRWTGEYRIIPTPVWDSARRFTSNMFRPGAMQCVSFHSAKILADTQGGAILHDNDEADAWLRRARFDGRTEGADPLTDQVQYPSWHAYLSPDVAARLLWKLQALPKHNEDLPNSRYPDLSLLEAFK